MAFDPLNEAVKADDAIGVQGGSPWGQFQRGDYGAGTANLLTGYGPITDIISDIGSGPKPIYYGGSPEAQAEALARYQAGQASGQQMLGQGVNVAGAGIGVIGQGAQMYSNLGTQGANFAAQGQGIGTGAITSQDNALRQMIDAARMDTASVAEAQMRANANQANAAMMAQAASARGGNQAAAIRGAQATGSNVYNNAIANAGVMRAQEEAARANRIAAAQQAAAGAYGQRAGLGFGMQGQGLGIQGAAAGGMVGAGGQIVSGGLGVGGLGAQTTGQYLGAETTANAAVLDAQQKNEAARLEKQGGMIGGGIQGGLKLFGM